MKVRKIRLFRLYHFLAFIICCFLVTSCTGNKEGSEGTSLNLSPAQTGPRSANSPDGAGPFSPDQNETGNGDSGKPDKDGKKADLDEAAYRIITE